MIMFILKCMCLLVRLLKRKCAIEGSYKPSAGTEKDKRISIMHVKGLSGHVKIQNKVILGHFKTNTHHHKSIHIALTKF